MHPDRGRRSLGVFGAVVALGALTAQTALAADVNYWYRYGGRSSRKPIRLKG